MPHPFFYFGLALIFASGMAASQLAVVTAATLSYSVIESAAPTLAMEPEWDDSSRQNAVLQATYGLPLLTIGVALVFRKRQT